MPLNPTEAEQYAAGRLQRYIAMATGKALPFAEERQTAHKIYIGAAARVARETLKHDGFIIRTDDTSLHLAGAIDRGTIYAVNTFLEKYVGVRIYEGGVERVLPAEKIAVPAQLSVTENPVFQMRRTSHATTADPDYAVWMKFNSSLARLEEKHGGTLSTPRFKLSHLKSFAAENSILKNIRNTTHSSTASASSAAINPTSLTASFV